MSKTKTPDNTLVTLFDLNPDCLEYASARCRQAHSDVVSLEVEAVRGDFRLRVPTHLPCTTCSTPPDDVRRNTT